MKGPGAHNVNAIGEHHARSALHMCTQSRTGPLQFDRLIPEKERQERCARVIQAAAKFNCHADLLLLGLPRKSSQASHS
jgi:hypothetical protein